MRGFQRCLAVLATVSAAGLATAAPADQPADEPVRVIGLEPSVRPDWAPRVTTIERTPGWFERALSGIEPPYPASLRFLEDVGNWHEPFIRPGMTGPYDIRGWHSQ